MMNHHGQEEAFLVLPCDWRFLPKLGPRRSLALGPFFSLARGTAPVTCFHSVVLTDGTIFFSSDHCAAQNYFQP
jgi:hypothetical protein